MSFLLERADFGPGAANLMPERDDLRPYRPNLKPERHHLKLIWGVGMDEERMGEQKSPRFLYDFIPFGAAVQKRKF